MPENITDRDFVIYRDKNVYLGGQIQNGQLKLGSSVYGEEYDSEQHIDFTVEDTKKLFTLMTFDEFIAFVREKHLIGLNAFLKENGIAPSTTTF